MPEYFTRYSTFSSCCHFPRILIFCLTLPLFLLGTATTLPASHFVGGEISYDCLGGSQYRIHATMYYDCGGAFPPGSIPVNFTSANCASFFTRQMPEITRDTVPNCMPMPSSCQGGNFAGWTRIHFSDTVTLPAVCTDWRVSYTTCCRNPTLTNIQANSGWYLDAWIDNTICNNSPRFNLLNQTFACLMTGTQLDFSGSDPDGDSLVYNLTTAMNTTTQPTTYINGLSPTLPIATTNNQVNINSATGIITCNPMGLQFPVVVVEILEYRNGVQVGRVARDLPMVIVNCPGWFCNGNTIQGKVYDDFNMNCTKDVGEANLAFWNIEVQPTGWIFQTDANGNYTIFVDTGSYTIRAIPPSNTWSFNCPTGDSLNFSFTTLGNTTTGNDIGAEPNTRCPDMEVRVNTTGFRPCLPVYIWAQYENNGTDTAHDAQIKVTLPPFIVYDTATVIPDSIVNDCYWFSIGDVPPSNNGLIKITTVGDCDTTWLGRTQCIEAHVYPDSFCDPPSPNWDGSHIEITESCVGDSMICFNVRNTGAAMAAPTAWRNYSNSSSWLTGTLQLCAGCDTTFCWLTSGETIRLEVDQHPDHPGDSRPTRTVENCGATPWLGHFMSRPQDDRDDFIDIWCRRVVNSYDPNDKQVSPVGVGIDHVVDSGAVLEYTIRFQNTGTAPAINVWLSDTLEPWLDLSSVQPIAGSHPHIFQTLPDRTLRWTFMNINLPDSVNDEPNSHGWVRFSAQVDHTTPMGTQVRNNAAIYFDFNAPVITNEVFNTVDELLFVATEPEVLHDDVNIRIFPHPVRESARIVVDGAAPLDEMGLDIYDIQGKLIRTASFRGGNYLLERNGLQAGIYVYRIRRNGSVIGAGKLMLQPR